MRAKVEMHASLLRRVISSTSSAESFASVLLGVQWFRVPDFRV